MVDELTLARVLDIECQKHEVDVLTVLAAVARLVAVWCLAGAMATSSRHEVAQNADRLVEGFLRVLAVHLAHADVKLREPPH